MPHTNSHSNRSRRHTHPGTGASGKHAAAVCVLFAFVGLGCKFAVEFIAPLRAASSANLLTMLAGTLALAALGLGLYAQNTQRRLWSRRVRRRLLLGIPVAFLTLLTVVANVLFPQASLRPAAPDEATPSSAQRPAKTEDTSLIKPGWYGELQQDGVLLVITSFPENATESRQFNRRLLKPVSYATLSIINLGGAERAILNALEVALRLDSGEAQRSLVVRPLLAHHAANTALLERLAVPQEIAVGAMAADIPVCLAPDFPWDRVNAVAVTLGERTFNVPGRMVTAEEKLAMVEKSANQNRSASTTNRSAEAWFKDF